MGAQPPVEGNRLINISANGSAQITGNLTVKVIPPTPVEPDPPDPDPTDDIWYTDAQLREFGYISVTEFGADPTGVQDSTQAIQDAIAYSIANIVTVYLPNKQDGTRGEYLVSDSLMGMSPMDTLFSARGDRRFFARLRGSLYGRQRPLIRLADNSAGFNDPDNPKAVIWLWLQGTDGVTDPKDVNTGQGFFLRAESLDFVLGNNPGAVAVTIPGAQMAGAKSMKIDATGALAGIWNHGVLGHSYYDFEIIGGKYAVIIDTRGRRIPSNGHPAHYGFTCRDQELGFVLATVHRVML